MEINLELTESINRLTKEFGEPVFYDTKNRLIGVNQIFMANFFKFIHDPVFETTENKFYIYGEDGLWKQKSDNYIIYELGKMIFEHRVAFCEPDLQCKAPAKILKEIFTMLTACAAKRNFFSAPVDRVVHCGNGVLVYDHAVSNWVLKSFSPDFRSRNSSNIHYNSTAGCPQFIEKLILSAMTEEDADLLQLYVGQCLIGRNSSQTFLLLTGTPGGGKSTLCNLIEALIGRHNCTELRLEHMGSRFELQRLVGKTLLTAKDVKSDFLNSAGAYKLKSLVGNDTMTIESKNRNDSADINGIFNAIITCNNNLRVAFDGDEDAWRRRILWIKYNNPPPKEKIVDFDKKLLTEEGSGILNWALEGANKLMKLNGKIPIGQEQKARIDDLLLESNSINVFVDECVKPTPTSTVTCSDLLVAFTKYCKNRQWENLPERVFQKNLPDIMLHKYNAVKRTDIKNKHNKYNRGYAGFALITQEEDCGNPPRMSA